MTARFIIVLIVVIAIDAALFVWLIANPSAANAAALVVLSLAIVPIVALLAFHMIWRPLFTRYPPQRPSLGAERRRFQSMSIGIVNMGFSVHIATDEEFLHLEPLGVWQVLGACAASIPWSALVPASPAANFSPFGVAVTLDGQTITAPKWCLERVLAS